MSARTEATTTPAAELRELRIDEVVPNSANPRLDFPQDELNRLADSIDHEGVLVPIVVYPSGEKFVLVDGERRYRCARDLGLDTIPALVTSERSEREVLQQMFNIHLIREPWRDIPTAKALQKLAQEIQRAEGREPNDQELRDLTGLSIERVRQLRYVVQLPDEWQDYIREGTIPLNFFWELKKNVLDALQKHRPSLYAEYGEKKISESFVQKRLDQVITDTVSLRKVSPIVKFAAADAAAAGDDTSVLDDSLRTLITDPQASVDDAYDETVSLMVEVDKLEKRTNTMVSVFTRLLKQTAGTSDQDTVRALGRQFVARLTDLLDDARPSD
jgi:ParB/RepB/Spo0J family partition protein